MSFRALHADRGLLTGLRTGFSNTLKRSDPAVKLTSTSLLTGNAGQSACVWWAPGAGEVGWAGAVGGQIGVLGG